MFKEYFRQAGSQVIEHLLQSLETQTNILALSHHIGPGVRSYARSYHGQTPADFVPAGINRHTGKPHEHRREIARRTGAR